MTTFLILGIVGLLLLTASLLLGDLFDGVLDGLFDALAGDIFSTAVIGAFVSAFGFGGAIAVGSGLPGLVAIPIGIASGVGFGWFAVWLTRLIRDGGSDGTPHTSDVLGRDGTVISPIPADGYGTVRVLLGGHVLRLNARADRPLDTGVEIHVTNILSPTAVDVAPLWDQIELPSSP
ncbi:hypothetical protein GCM10027020_28490 [Nocardioides salsibiostraticola]